MSAPVRRVFACGNRDRQLIAAEEEIPFGKGNSPEAWPVVRGLRARNAKLATTMLFRRAAFEDIVIDGGMRWGGTAQACVFDRVVLKGDLRNLWIRREPYPLREPVIDPDILWRWHQSVEFALDITEMVPFRCYFDLDIPPDKIRRDPTRQILLTPDRVKAWWEGEGHLAKWHEEASLVRMAFFVTLNLDQCRTRVVFAPGPREKPREMAAATHDFALLLASGVGVPP